MIIEFFFLFVMGWVIGECCECVYIHLNNCWRRRRGPREEPVQAREIGIELNSLDLAHLQMLQMCHMPDFELPSIELPSIEL